MRELFTPSDRERVASNGTLSCLCCSPSATTAYSTQFRRSSRRVNICAHSMQAGVRPGACNVLERIARASDPHARVWKGPGLPEERQGMKVFGAPLGHPAFVEAFLEKKVAEQLFQTSWLILVHCAAARGKLLVAGGRIWSSGAVRQ